MTARPIFSRPIAALSAMVTLATALVLTVAPSTARAETGKQIIMSDGDVDCPPCRLLAVHDRDGLSFGEVVAEVQGDELVITAQVDVPSTAGRPRTGTVVFSAFMSYSDEDGFMDFTDDACMATLMGRQAGAQACAELSRAVREASTAALTAPVPGPIVAPSSVPAEGIIMRDGGVCDPIRHMGC